MENQEVDVEVEKEVDVEDEKDIGSAGSDSRSRPYKEVDVDIEKEKMFLSRFKPSEDLSGYTEEELEEERQTKLQALQKFREEAKK